MSPPKDQGEYMSFKKTALAVTLVSLGLAAGASASADRVAGSETNELSAFVGGNQWGTTILGDQLAFGNGTYRAFSRLDANGTPVSVGVVFPKATLEGLPGGDGEPLHDGKTCYDLDGNDTIDLHAECVGGHSKTLHFGDNGTPFNSITINWEPHGHVPDGVYNKPHFDFHFYMISQIERRQITPGECFGLMNCAQEQIAINPVPDQYIHPDYINTQLAFAHMGNHYVDSLSPELNGGEYTHTFILGAYDGLITFYEPMITREFLLSEPNSCYPIKQPAAFQESGYYPEKYCIQYNPWLEHYKVSLENFQYQQAL